MKGIVRVLNETGFRIGDVGGKFCFITKQKDKSITVDMLFLFCDSDRVWTNGRGSLRVRVSVP